MITHDQWYAERQPRMNYPSSVSKEDYEAIQRDALKEIVDNCALIADLNEARDKVDSLETQNRAIKGQLKYLEDDSIAELVQLQKVCDELAAALRKDTVASFAIANSKPDAATICKQADDMHVTALTNYSTLPHVKAKENKL
jgi:hypothetical protein